MSVQPLLSQQLNMVKATTPALRSTQSILAEDDCATIIFIKAAVVGFLGQDVEGGAVSKRNASFSDRESVTLQRTRRCTTVDRNIWDYGMVVGYTWNDATETGGLQVTFVEGTSEIPYEEDGTQDLALETYELRPCSQRSVVDIMPAEMRSMYNSVHHHFNGVGQAARWNSSTILRSLTLREVVRFRGRPDDESRAPGAALTPGQAKRRRVETEESIITPDESRLFALRRRLVDDPLMARDINQLIGLRQATLGKGSSISLVVASGSETKSQYKPSRQQTIGHRFLSMVSTHRWIHNCLLRLYSQTRRSSVICHTLELLKDVLAGIFGFRGYICYAFVPVNVDEEREYQRTHDMTDVLKKNKLSGPPKAVVIADVSTAPGGSYSSCERQVNDRPRSRSRTSGWIDCCFQQFRSCLVREDLAAAAEVKLSFQFCHESYAQVVQRVTNLKVEAALKSSSREPYSSQSEAQYDVYPGTLRGGGGLANSCRPVGCPDVATRHYRDVDKLLYNNCGQVVYLDVVENHTRGVSEPLQGGNYPQTSLIAGLEEMGAYVEAQQRRYTMSWQVRQRLLSLQQDSVSSSLSALLASYDIPPWIKFTIGTGE
ncbi:hypothetical protein GQ600_1222 [Phytophthora cactorum]|nr:hypothetical protein GQ600_1222 [Phytophthora cactorum]